MHSRSQKPEACTAHALAMPGCRFDSCRVSKGGPCRALGVRSMTCGCNRETSAGFIPQRTGVVGQRSQKGAELGRCSW